MSFTYVLGLRLNRTVQHKPISNRIQVLLNGNIPDRTTYKVKS